MLAQITRHSTPPPPRPSITQSHLVRQTVAISTAAGGLAQGVLLEFSPHEGALLGPAGPNPVLLQEPLSAEQQLAGAVSELKPVHGQLFLPAEQIHFVQLLP